MCSCGSCRRLLNQACACAGNGRPTRHDCIFPMRASRNYGGFSHRSHCIHRGSATGIRRIPHCTGLVADCLWYCRFARGVPYLLSDKPPKIDGKRLKLQFELRAPATLKIPKQPDGYSIQVSLYTDNRQSSFAFIDWNGITKSAEHVTIPGDLSLLTHSKSRSLLASIGNEPAASQFIELKNLSPAPRKQDEAWSDWIFATARADLSSIPEGERFAIRYRIQPVER
jgi:hypothetical protein